MTGGLSSGRFLLINSLIARRDSYLLSTNSSLGTQVQINSHRLDKTLVETATFVGTKVSILTSNSSDSPLILSIPSQNTRKVLKCWKLEHYRTPEKKNTIFTER